MAVAATWFLTRDSGGGAGGTTLPGDDSFPTAIEVLGPGPGPQQGVTGTFDLGPETPVGAQTVGPAGGVVVGAGGLTITVPAGAHPAPTEYTVVSQQILGHDFGPSVTPATPMYTVDNGGGYSDALITLDVPVVVPPEHIAIGFFYDQVTGELEAIPAVAMDDDSLTLVTRHFSTFFIDIIGIGSLPIMAPAPDVDSGFRPGVDDWQFRNLGSAAASGGHCAGQSLSAMWYYDTQRRSGAPWLNGLYDNNGEGATPGLWEDDSQAYRLCSTVQGDYAAIWNAQGPELISRLSGSWKSGLWQFAQFLGAIHVTHQPQFVAMWSSKGGGHAMVVYGGGLEGLWVADPNYPSQYRLIPWDLDKLQLGPYSSGATAAELGTPYETIAFIAKTALIDWPTLGGRWAEFIAGNAGDSVFPGYAIKAAYDDDGGNRRERFFSDHLIVALDEVALGIDLPDPGDCRIPPVTGPAHPCGARVTIYDGTAPKGTVTCTNPTDPTTCSAEVKVDLKEGDNDFGGYVEVERVITRVVDKKTEYSREWRYVDFHDFTITNGSGLALEMVPDESEAAGLEMLVKDAPVLVENPDVPGEIIAITATYKAGPAVEGVPEGEPSTPYGPGWWVTPPVPDDICMGSGWGGAAAGFGPNLCIEVRLSLWDGDSSPFDPAAVRTEALDVNPTPDPCRVEGTGPFLTWFPCVESFTGNADQGVEIFGWSEEDRNLGVSRYRVRAVVEGIRIDVATAYRNYLGADVRTDRMREVVTALVNEIAQNIRAVTGG